jgi:hypothetical protein
MGRQSAVILKLQQDMRTALKKRSKRAREEQVLEGGEVRNESKLEHSVVCSSSKDPEGRKRKVETGYYLTGVISGLAMKRTGATSANTCGLFRLAGSDLGGDGF